MDGYVDRNDNGGIVSIFGSPQHEGQEYVEGAVLAKSLSAIKEEALDNLAYDFEDGRVMQVRPKDEGNIRNALEIMEALNLPAMEWRMQDDTIHPVTADELKGALLAGQIGAMEIWNTYNAG